MITRNPLGMCKHVNWAHPFSVCIKCHPEILDDLDDYEEIQPKKLKTLWDYQ